MAFIIIGPWQRDSMYRVHSLGLMDSTYRVPLLDSKLVRLRYTWYYHIKSPQDLVAPSLRSKRYSHSFLTLNTVEVDLMYPNLYTGTKTDHFTLLSLLYERGNNFIHLWDL